MFGHQDDKKDNDKPAEHQEQTVAPNTPADGQAATPSDHQPANGQKDDQKAANNLHGFVAPPDNHAGGNTDKAAAPDNSHAPAGDDHAWQHPGAPIDEDTEPGKPEPIKDIIGPPGGNAPILPDHINHYDEPDEHSAIGDDSQLPHELIDIKQKALGQLTPLMDELDQSPEDKFRTTMMMIQASDDQNLVKLAYETANKIKDDKARAQAYLDIVNEINYFTQHPGN